MKTFMIEVADGDSGREKSFEVTANTEQEAHNLVQGQGWLVRKSTLVKYERSEPIKLDWKRLEKTISRGVYYGLMRWLAFWLLAPLGAIVVAGTIVYGITMLQNR